MIKNPKLTRRDLLDWPKGPKTMRPTHRAGFFIGGFIYFCVNDRFPKSAIEIPPSRPRQTMRDGHWAGTTILGDNDSIALDHTMEYASTTLSIQSPLSCTWFRQTAHIILAYPQLAGFEQYCFKLLNILQQRSLQN